MVSFLHYQVIFNPRCNVISLQICLQKLCSIIRLHDHQWDLVFFQSKVLPYRSTEQSNISKIHEVIVLYLTNST